jgi:hypothetical protein
VILVLLGFLVAAIVFVVTGGHVLFLPLFLILPLGLFRFGRRRNTWRRF